MEKVSFETPTLFKSPEEELNFLREQVRNKEKELESKGEKKERDFNKKRGDYKNRN